MARIYPPVLHRPRPGRGGFTLVELLTVVAILGVLASVAIPAFIQYTLHARAAEASQQLRNMFSAAASFYTTERTLQGTVGSQQTYCVVSSAPMSPTNPSASKQSYTPTGSLADPLGFTIADYVYFGYSLASIATTGTVCSNAPGASSLYTMRAHGDLDGDSTRSTYELTVGSDASNSLYHARGFYIISPIE